jgi:uridine monophosphate synthetase
MEERTKLALRLLEIGAIRFGEFRLKLHEKNPDAPLSPIYIDLRLIRSFPDVLDATVSVYRDLIRGLHFDCYADVPTAATPIVTLLAHETGRPMISPRLDHRTHGLTGKVDGQFAALQVALLVDDIITTAESKLEAIDVLLGNGLRVQDVVVLVDREQGGVQELESRGYRCHAGFTLRELLTLYLHSGRIDRAHHDKTISYLESDRP